MTGDDFPLTRDEVCTAHPYTFRAIWFVNAFLYLTLIAHATSKLPLDVGKLRRLVRKGAPRTLSLWILVSGMLGTSFCCYKAATLWFFTDHTKVFPVLAHAMHIGIFFGPVWWSFFFAVVAPFLATARNSAALVACVKKQILLLGLLCSTLVVAVAIGQALRAEGEERVMLNIVCLSSWAFDTVVALLALGIACRKVYGFSFVFVSFHTDQ
jgi:Na+-driven multidrug efflux pump